MAISLNTKFSILFVEDDEVDIQSVLRTVKKFALPLEFYIAKNGIEALDKLRGTSGVEKIFPSLILLDINMPKMNGIEFLKILRTGTEFHHLKVYILTTAYTGRDKIATQNLNVAGYIVKPLEYSDLQTVYWSLMQS